MVKLARTFLCTSVAAIGLTAFASTLSADESGASHPQTFLGTQQWLATASSFCSDPTLPKARLDMTYVWSGRCENSLLEGLGTLSVYERGPLQVTLTGTFVHGVAEGREVLEYVDGTKFDGEFHGNQPNGHGIYSDAQGGSTEGDFKDDMLEGKALTVDSDRSVFSGTYKDNEQDGPYTFQTAHSYRQEGTFRSGKLNGLVTDFFPGGDKLAGNCIDGVFDKTWLYTASDGQSFRGNLVAAKADPSKPHTLDYPFQARQRGQQGSVEVSVAISASGQVTYARIVQSSGWEALDQAARDAVISWQYLPATVNSHPVPSVQSVTVPFVLRDPNQPAAN